MAHHWNTANRAMVLSFKTLRAAIGVLAILLPIVLLWVGGPRLDTISDYFYSDLGTYFTGTLCAISVFLFAYHGFDKADRICSAFAATMAAIVAFTPCGHRPAAQIGVRVWTQSYQQSSAPYVHLIAAGLFLSTLAVFCLLFRQSNAGPNKTRRKILRNRVYLVCAVVIAVCVTVLLATHTFAPGVVAHHDIFWWEAAAVWAFGASWFVKSELVLPG